MNYTLHQLQVFLKIVETKSITKAANELYLTQPAVSIQLKNFQDQFDIALTEVLGKQLYVTDFGKEIAGMAERIIQEVEAINYKTQTYKGILSGRLKLAIVSTGKYIMPYFLTGFIKHNPAVDLTMDVTNKAMVISSLENNEIDFALVSLLPDKLQVEQEILLENHLYLVGNKEEKFSSKPYKRSIFDSLPMIYREAGSGTRSVMENFLEKSKITVKKKMELTSNEAVKQAVIAGLGYSIMPLIGIHGELVNDSLQIIPVEGLPARSTWRLIWLKNKKLSPTAWAFLEYIRKNKIEILHDNFGWVEEFNKE
ncbi:LysR family transcriptional regulator [Mucilaginibacter antarcticus]|uniref:LysR family transcriptional regulator n=1 Tax=Mucilaginibacter antarcticus TaxID=1855725 RepID=A0ABW5XSX9_9SPHI